MYIAKYELDSIGLVKQSILKIDIIDTNKIEEIYNFCLNKIIKLNKQLYISVSFRILILPNKIEIVLFFTYKNIFDYLNKIKEDIYKIFDSKICHITLPDSIDEYNNISNVNIFSNISRLNNTSYYIGNKLIGIEFNIGSVVEKIINYSIKNKTSFLYQFTLKPYNFNEKKNIERFAKKYILKMNDEVYMPNKLVDKLYSIVNKISKMEFFIDEMFAVSDKNLDFFNVICSDEFALKLSKYGFDTLPIEKDMLSRDLLYTGLSSLDISEVLELSKVFSSIDSNILESFTIKHFIMSTDSKITKKEYDIFISYSTVNTYEADKLCYELEKEGFHCWYAPKDILPSKQYPEEIIRGIKSSKYFVLLHSKHASVSRYVLREVTKALSLNKIIIPILLDTSNFSENMEFILETCQWIDANSKSLNDVIDELKTTLYKLS